MINRQIIKKYFPLKRLLLLAGILLLIGIYLPYFIQGGFVIDDRAIVSAGISSSGIGESYQGLFNQFSNRPLAPLIFSIANNILPASPWAYILLNTFIWLLGIAIVAIVLRHITSTLTASVFFWLAAIPVVCSTVIFSPAVMLMGSFSILFWACSLVFLHFFILRKNWYWILFSSICLLLSVFAYEATLPLFILNAFLPLLYSERKNYIFKYIFPVAVVVLLAFLYQKNIAPHLALDISRIRFRGLVIVPAVLSKFLFLLIADIPIILARSLRRVFEVPWALLLGIFSALLITMISRDKSLIENEQKQVKKTIWIFSISALSAIGLYILAGTIPMLYGYDNRGLIGFAVALALLVSYLFSLTVAKKGWLFYAFIAVFVVYTATFAISIRQYSVASSTHMAIKADLAEKVQKEMVPASDFVLANVPTHLMNNFANETIFSDEEDAKFSIKNAENEDVLVIMLTKRRIGFGRAFITENNTILSDDFEGPVQNAWYYQTDENINSSLEKIQNLDRLNEIINSIETKLNNPPLPPNPWLKTIEFYKNYINIPDITSHYERYLSRWQFN